MPDPDKFPAEYFNTGYATIERAQQDAMQKLRMAGIPERRMQAAVARIRALCLIALSELAEAHADFAAFAAQPGLSRDMQDRVAFFRLQLNKAVAVIAAKAIHDAIADYQNPPERYQPVIEVMPRHSWERGVLKTLLNVVKTLLVVVLWLLGIAAAMILTSMVTGTLFWVGITGLLSLLVWLFLSSRWWNIVLPIATIGLLIVYAIIM